MRKRLLIIGGSYAASELACKAREFGYCDDILMVSDEGHLPYHRPPLSKSFMANDNEALTPLRVESFYNSRAIEIELNTKVSSIDGFSKVAKLSNHRSVSFDTLAFATGARTRVFSGLQNQPHNVYYLRNATDAQKLRAAVVGAENVIVIGAGFIGLEVSSVLVQQSKNVTVLEASDRVLARAVSPSLSSILASKHLSHGVNLKCSVKSQLVVDKDNCVRRVELDDGTVLAADVVVIGIGSEANTSLARELDLGVRDGIVVNDRSQTSREDVFAAGDCASFVGPFNRTGIRLESVQNAMEQASIAGNAVAGGKMLYHAVPWFWSDQYDFKVQIAGLAIGANSQVVRGDSANPVVFHFVQDTCVCVETVNRPRDHISARRLLKMDTHLSKHRLEQFDFDLSSLLKAEAELVGN